MKSISILISHEPDRISHLVLTEDCVEKAPKYSEFFAMLKDLVNMPMSYQKLSWENFHFSCKDLMWSEIELIKANDPTVQVGGTFKARRTS